MPFYFGETPTILFQTYSSLCFDIYMTTYKPDIDFIFITTFYTPFRSTLNKHPPDA